MGNDCRRAAGDLVGTWQNRGIPKTGSRYNGGARLTVLQNEGSVMNWEVAPPVSVPDSNLLIESDGIPLESHWHVLQIHLLIDSISYWFRFRDDFYAGGNMFIYFSEEQARNRDYRGPDFFYVDGVNRWP